jgi:hypothetical protein
LSPDIGGQTFSHGLEPGFQHTWLLFTVFQREIAAKRDFVSSENIANAKRPDSVRPIGCIDIGAASLNMLISRMVSLIRRGNLSGTGLVWGFGVKMAMKRTKSPWMPADEFGRSLPRGIGLNLLVSSVEPMERFCREILGANTIYSDEDFAVVELAGSVMLLHADHTYLEHPMIGVLAGIDVRGAGAEIRIYGMDPDRIEARARNGGFTVLAGCTDKPHGLRECFLIGPENYVFVPCGTISQ